MFELADRLVGIYKTDNCTKSVTINPHLIEETVPQSQPQANITQVSEKLLDMKDDDYNFLAS